MNIFIVDLESVPTRYTCEWKEHVPKLLRQYAEQQGLNVNIVNISGGEQQIEASPGAFLNFQKTNIYKNNQMDQIAKMFTDTIKPGDRFLFTDFWNTGILQLKYMSELLGIPVEIHALVHAGSYDPHDFLGRLIKDKRWVNATEKAIAYAVDFNWFATHYHKDMFMRDVFEGMIIFDCSDDEMENKFRLTGWPMEYLPDVLSKYKGTPKENIVVFPHRISSEKQPEIFRDLAKSLPQYEFILCQEKNLTKEEYHKILAKSKVMFSASLQETLGICPYEGMLLDVYPMVPHRLSYIEMYDFYMLYPSIWTIDYDGYLKYKDNVIERLVYCMEEEHNMGLTLNELKTNYFSAHKLLKVLMRPDGAKVK